jgi:hypothetical protein
MKAAGIIILLIALVVAFGDYIFERPPVSLRKLENLKAGDTKHSVAMALGRPTSTNESEWVYTRPGGWGIVRIFFDTNGTVLRHDYDR